MKKFIIVGLIIQLLLTACSKNKNSEPFDPDFDAFLKEWDLSTFYYQSPCKSVKDAVNDVSITYEDVLNGGGIREMGIADEVVAKMSTCGLLETVIDSGRLSSLGPWIGSSDFWWSGITINNNRLRTNKVAVELFSRSDCFSVLASKFLTFIMKVQGQYTQQACYVMVLASDMCMELLNKQEKVQLMAMAVKMAEVKISVNDVADTNELGQLMIAIMQSYRYVPFMEDVGARLFETTWGYSFDWPDGFFCYGLDPSRFDIILEYAKHFLNEQNKML